MSIEQNRVEAALDLLRFQTAAGPMIEGFKESVQVDKAVAFLFEDSSVAVLAPGIEFPENTTVILASVEGWFSDDRLRIGFFLNSMDDLKDAEEEEREVDSIGSVEIGYGMGSDKGPRGAMSFEVEANLPEDFDPRQPEVRWVLGRISRVGELVQNFVALQGEPKPQPVSQEEALAALRRISESMARNARTKMENIRNRPQPE